MRNKTSKAIATATIGAAAVLALGACSSNANQAQESNTPSQTDASRDAASKPSQSTPLKGALSDVSLSHAAGVTCREYKIENANQQTYECTNIRKDDGASAVVVKIPGEAYKVTVLDPSDGTTGVIAVQRDANGKVVNETRYHQRSTFSGGQVSSAASGWTVEAGTGIGGTARVFITVIKG